MFDLLVLLLPIAAFSGWYLGTRRSSTKVKGHSALPVDYFVGLNYLLNEEPDKAVDVFIKILDVDSDTVETHLALGSVFRRRGEVARAIRIHQNLIARPHLSRSQRIYALMELGQDYMRAGVLNRAEGVFLDIVETGDLLGQSLTCLLEIYQSEKDWDRALATAEKLESIGEETQLQRAHYYCELSKLAQKKGLIDKADHFLKKAQSVDKNCVRASLLQAQAHTAASQYKKAIRFYKRVKEQDADFLTETLIPLAHCYEQIGQAKELLRYLEDCVTDTAAIPAVLLLADYLRSWEDDKTAISFTLEQLHRRPSIRGLNHLIKLQSDNAKDETKEILGILGNVTEKLLEVKSVYRCVHCGFSSKSLRWQCPGCKRWSSIKPIYSMDVEV